MQGGMATQSGTTIQGGTATQGRTTSDIVYTKLITGLSSEACKELLTVPTHRIDIYSIYMANIQELKS